MFGVIGGGQIADDIAQSFVADSVIFRELSGLEFELTGEVKSAMNRHVMRLIRCRKYKLAFEEYGGAPAVRSKFFLDVLKEETSAIVATQLIEDMNGVMAIQSLAPSRRFRKGATSMAKVLEENTIERTHRYKDVNIEVVAPVKSATLLESACGVAKDKPSMDFKPIVGKGQASWYSPCYTRTTTPAADLPMWRQAKALGNYAAVENAWLGRAFDCQNHLAVGIQGEDLAGPRSWYVAINIGRLHQCYFCLYDGCPWETCTSSSLSRKLKSVL